MTGQTSALGIVARDVCKSFGSHLVLDKVNLTADVGSILALVSPDGAGKPTMVRIRSTVITSDSGFMEVAGHDVVSVPDGVRALIAVTGQFSAVDNVLTGAENLRLMAVCATSAASQPRSARSSGRTLGSSPTRFFGTTRMVSGSAGSGNG
jgi:ABC-2 type transport system ATP-binding protein